MEIALSYSKIVSTNRWTPDQFLGGSVCQSHYTSGNSLMGARSNVQFWPYRRLDSCLLGEYRFTEWEKLPKILPTRDLVNGSMNPIPNLYYQEPIILNFLDLAKSNRRMKMLEVVEGN